MPLASRLPQYDGVNSCSIYHTGRDKKDKRKARKISRPGATPTPPAAEEAATVQLAPVKSEDVTAAVKDQIAEAAAPTDAQVSCLFLVTLSAALIESNDRCCNACYLILESEVGRIFTFTILIVPNLFYLSENRIPMVYQKQLSKMSAVCCNLN